MPTDYVTAADLAALGVDPDAVAVRFPWAVELTALDGRPCWAVDDLGLDDGGDA